MSKQLYGNFRKASSLIFVAKNNTKVGTQFDFNVLLFNRQEKRTFMPNTSVFPGGVCETSDETTSWHNHFLKLGVTEDQLKSLTPVKTNVSDIFRNDHRDVLQRELSLRITAIRETFEELGIMLCLDRKSLNARNDKAYARFKEDFDRKHWQALVHNDASKFLTLCEELQVVPDLWSLYEWSNWLTPSAKIKRFDAAFFIAALEKIPDVIPEQSEVKNFAWKTPADHLKAHFNNEILLPPPQLYELSRLLNFTELEQVKYFAQQRSSEGSIVSLPVLYELKNGKVSLLPGDDQYPENPNATDCMIKINKEITEFRKDVKNIHRLEFYDSHDTVIRQNFTPFCGHVAPINANPKYHD